MNCLSLETFERDLRRMTDMDYKELLEQIKDFLSSCEKMRYGEYVGAQWPYDHAGEMVYTEPEDILLDLAATAITDLLARAEAAEAAQETLQRSMAEYKARAEKAERGRDAAIKCIRHYGWCAGCNHFRGIKGCAGVGLKNCNEQNDHYEFGQKEE